MSLKINILNHISQEHQKQAKNKCITNLELGHIGNEDPITNKW